MNEEEKKEENRKQQTEKSNANVDHRKFELLQSNEIKGMQRTRIEFFGQRARRDGDDQTTTLVPFWFNERERGSRTSLSVSKE